MKPLRLKGNAKTRLWQQVLDRGKMSCDKCNDSGWVCEEHPDIPWETGEENDCDCGGAGMPCECNPGGAIPADSVLLVANVPVMIYRKGRDMNPQPKPKTHRSKPYRTWLTTQPCVACGQSSVKGIRDVVASHKGGGMGTKGPDKEAVSLCVDCHGIEHRAPESFWQSVTLITGKNRDAYVKALWMKYQSKSLT